jgi:UDP-N-acetylglucosamine--N-acetylmuramyl-(pentapeptide) pyrophosphoryl-undecaprenol N-acetylglucosamine transferase
VNSLKTKIMVVAGGSGGHIFPAVGFCQELKEARPDAGITFITTAGKMAGALIPLEYNPVFLKAGKSPIALLRLILAAVVLVGRKNPKTVCGFGGYLSVPFLLMARILGKETLLHEQNVVPGQANRFLSGLVDKIAISFSGTERYFKRHKNKIFLCRYPLRKSLKRIDKEEAMRFFGFSNGSFTLLVVGGSQGAHRLNELFLEALPSERNLSKLQIIHITGAADFSSLAEAYRQMPAESRVFAFLPEMNYAYSAADLVVSRAGASTISEIMYFGLPSVLIPYPHAAGHQKENAKVLAQRGASILLEEEKATSTMIIGLLDILFDDSIRRKTMSALATALYEESQDRKVKDLIL